jgi:hypothetical protein
MVSLCWAIGGTWGPVDDDESLAALHRAAELPSPSDQTMALNSVYDRLIRASVHNNW